MLKVTRTVMTACSLLALGSGAAMAQVNVTEERVSVTGIVTEIDNFGSVTIQSGASDFRIDTSELDADFQLDNLLREGMEVYVVGELQSGAAIIGNSDAFEDFVIEAEQVRVLGTYPTPDSDVLFLEDSIAR